MTEEEFWHVVRPSILAGHWYFTSPGVPEMAAKLDAKRFTRANLKRELARDHIFGFSLLDVGAARPTNARYLELARANPNATPCELVEIAREAGVRGVASMASEALAAVRDPI